MTSLLHVLFVLLAFFSLSTPAFSAKMERIEVAPDKNSFVLATELRKVDHGPLITVGMVDWSLDRPGLTSGFVPDRVAPDLNFISVHLYPEKGKVKQALITLAGFAIGKPVVIEETFPLRCSAEELEQFIIGSK